MQFAAFRYLLYDASLDAHGSVQKKKMKLPEKAGNEKIKQEQFILHFEFMGILSQGILKLDLGTNAPRQPSSTRPLSKIFFFSSLQRYKVKVSYYLRYNGFKNVFGFYFYSFTVAFEHV